MKQICILYIRHIRCYLPLSRSPSRDPPCSSTGTEVHSLYVYCQKREANPLHVADLPLVSYIPTRKKRKIKSSKVRYLYASSCEYLPKVKHHPSSFSFKEVRAGQLGGINGTTAIKSPMKGSHFSSYRVGPFVNQRNGGTKSCIWYHSRA